MKLKISIKDSRALEILDMADKYSMSDAIKNAMISAMEIASDYELS